MQSAARFALFPARAADTFQAMKRTHPPASSLSLRGDPARLALTGLLGALLMLAFAPQARAQVFSSTPYVAAPDPAVEEVRKRVEQLEADLRKAIDRAEVLGAQLSDARRIAEEANAGRKKAEADLDALGQRVQKLEDLAADASAAANAATVALQKSDGASATVSLTPASTARANVDLASLPEDEAGFFESAHALLLNGDYSAAQGAFSLFLTKYPKAENASEAQYFIGEALLYQDNYPDAAAAYGKLIKTYPNAARGPEGLVKLARALRLMEKKSEACKTLDLMGKQFPKASATARQLASTERQRSGCKG